MTGVHVWLKGQQRSIFVIKVTLPDTSVVGIAFEHRTVKEALTEEALYSKLMGRTVLDVFEVRYTLCTLYRLMPDGGEGKFTASIIASSKARCSPEDNFNKETGRKISLTRLLNKQYPRLKDNPDLTAEAGQFNKNIRQEIWQAYRMRGMMQALDEVAERAGQALLQGIPVRKLLTEGDAPVAHV